MLLGVAAAERGRLLRVRAAPRSWRRARRERFGELARELLSLSALLLPLPVIVLCADPEGVLPAAAMATRSLAGRRRCAGWARRSR